MSLDLIGAITSFNFMAAQVCSRSRRRTWPSWVACDRVAARRDVMRLRGVFSGLVATGLALALMPIGCGGDAGSGQVHHAPSPSLLSNDWTVPEDVMEKLRGCVTAHVRDLQTYAHQAKFEARIDEGGSVRGMRMRSSTLHHGEMESCMMRALVSLPVPMEEVLRYSRPVAESDSLGRERGALGIVQAIAGVALGPIIVIAAGVTLTVYVAVVVTEETLEAVRRTKRLERMCVSLRQECLGDKRLPPDSDFGTEKDCGSCFRLCMNFGYWPETKCPRPRSGSN